MDVICSNCGEPWDISEPPDEQGAPSPATLASDGKCLHCQGKPVCRCPECGVMARGSELQEGKFFCGWCRLSFEGKSERPYRAQVSGALAEVLGDDLDGLAAEMEDIEQAGLLNEPAREEWR